MVFCDGPPEILYRDAALLAVSKPSGWLSHPSPMAPSAENLMGWVRAKAGAWVFPAHRLDRPTSGVIAYGLTPAAASAFGEALQAGCVEKRYAAIVRGWIKGAGVIDKAVRGEDGALRPAVTRYCALAHGEGGWPVRPHATARYTLVALAPTTGRTHQLRQHLHAIAHPILGDTRYGDGAHNRAAAERLGVNRLLLHAFSLEFPSLVPGEARRIRVEAADFGPAFAAALSLFQAGQTADVVSAALRAWLWSPAPATPQA